jgi:hypothetical protein
MRRHRPAAAGDIRRPPGSSPTPASEAAARSPTAHTRAPAHPPHRTVRVRVRAHHPHCRSWPDNAARTADRHLHSRRRNRQRLRRRPRQLRLDERPQHSASKPKSATPATTAPTGHKPCRPSSIRLADPPHSPKAERSFDHHAELQASMVGPREDQYRRPVVVRSLREVALPLRLPEQQPAMAASPQPLFVHSGSEDWPEPRARVLGGVARALDVVCQPPERDSGCGLAVTSSCVNPPSAVADVGLPSSALRSGACGPRPVG